MLPDLHLTNTQVGLTASALSFAWAISGFLVGAASDRSGRRKVYLVAAARSRDIPPYEGASFPARRL